MPTGTIQVYTSAAEQAAALPGVEIRIFDEGGLPLASLTTDASGAAGEVSVPAPDKALSLEETSTQRPYAVYRVVAVLAGWQTVTLDGVQVFDGQQTVARIEMLPDTSALTRDGSDIVADQTVRIPPHSLYSGGGGSGPAPTADCPLGARVLTQVVIPKKITVHLGKPSANVANASVSFQNYIANVASSEVYPTWAGHR
ncbi:MAG: hypothetical protein ACI4OI_01780 [Gemmiger sp.]